MGHLVYGIHGPIVGKVGNVVGSSWRGIPYLRARGLRKKPPTEGEKINRFIFAKTQAWLQPIAEFVKVGFKNYTLKSQGIHAAKSYMYKHALIKNGYDSEIDPSLMKVSYGTLPLARDIRAEFDRNHDLVFTWDKKVRADEEYSDQVMILAYNVEEEDAFMITEGQLRCMGSDRICFEDLGEGSYHVYVAFVSKDRDRQSDSVYLGVYDVEKGEQPERKESKLVERERVIREAAEAAAKAFDEREFMEAEAMRAESMEEGCVKEELTKVGEVKVGEVVDLQVADPDGYNAVVAGSVAHISKDLGQNGNVELNKVAELVKDPDQNKGAGAKRSRKKGAAGAVSKYKINYQRPSKKKKVNKPKTINEIGSDVVDGVANMFNFYFNRIGKWKGRSWR